MNLTNKLWWKERDPQQAIFDHLAKLETDVVERNRLWTKYLSLLMNKTIPGFKPGEKLTADETFKNYTDGEKRLALNPIENCLASLAARIASQNPRAKFLTSTDGPEGWEMKRKAEGCEKFVAGEWYKNKVYRKTVKCFNDAGFSGIGYLKVFASVDGSIKFERVPPWEIIIDQEAAKTTDPRTLYHEMLIPAEILMGIYPQRSKLAAIDAAINDNTTFSFGLSIATDLVRVVEAWHLPSFKNAKDGKHAIVINGKTLEYNNYNYKTFPFAIFRWNEPILGWYPQGLVEQKENIQQQEIKLLNRIQNAMDIYSHTQTFYEEGSINKDKMISKTGILVPVRKGATMPITQMPASINSEVFRFLFQLDEKIYNESGVSQLSASSVKPPGIESGRALMVLKDTETGRHSLLNQAWDDFHIQIAELTIQCAKQITEEKGKYSTNYIDENKIIKIEWKDIDLDRDSYELQIFPSSMLPHEPAGRLEVVENMLANGFLNRQQALELLNMPDLEQYTSLETAQIRDIEKQIFDILDQGKYEAPQPYQNLELGLKMFQSALLRARQNEISDEKQQMLMDWMETATGILQESMAPPMPEGMPMGAGELPPMPEGIPSLPAPGGGMPEGMPTGEIPS